MELTKEYIDSENEEISIFCYAGELNLKTQDYLRLESSDFAPLRDLVDTTTGKFPESVKIANECLAVIVQLLSQDKRDDAIELMKIMQKNFEKSTDPKVIAASGALGDKIYLADIRFDQLVGNFRSGLAGSDEKYLQAGRDMAELENMGPTIYAEVINVARWLEQSGNIKKAGELLETLSGTLAKGKNKNLQEGAEQALTRFKTRSNLLGKSFKVAGRNRAAVEFDNKDLENKVVMIYFWSSQNLNSIQPLSSFLQLYAAYEGRGFEIVTYCVDTNPENAITMFGSNPPPWKNLFYNEKNADHKQMLRNSGVQFLPYVLLLDRDGKVTDINVPFTMIQPKLEPLLGSPLDQPASQAEPIEEKSDGSTEEKEEAMSEKKSG